MKLNQWLHLNNLVLGRVFVDMLQESMEWFIWKFEFHFSFFCYCNEVILKNVGNFPRVCEFHCLVTICIWLSRLFPGYQISDYYTSIFYIIVVFNRLNLIIFNFLNYNWKLVSVVLVFITCFNFLHRVFQFNAFLNKNFWRLW